MAALGCPPRPAPALAARRPRAAALSCGGLPRQASSCMVARAASRPQVQRWLLTQQHQRQRRQVAAAAAPAAAPAAAAATAFWPALVQAWSVNPASVLLAAGACILGVSLSVFLLAAIPTMMVRDAVGVPPACDPLRAGPCLPASGGTA